MRWQLANKNFLENFDDSVATTEAYGLVEYDGKLVDAGAPDYLTDWHCAL